MAGNDPDAVKACCLRIPKIYAPGGVVDPSAEANAPTVKAMTVRFGRRCRSSAAMSVVVNVKGGLGNQMFQYALARKLAGGNKAVLLDLSFFTSDGPETKRPFELDVFNVAYERAAPDILFPYQRIRASRLRAILSLSGHRIFNERGFAFDPSVLLVKGDTYVDGYWQSEKYFKDVSAAIRRDFSFKDEPPAPVADYMRRIEGCNAVSLHVRRGDYVSANPYYAMCDAAYYTRAVDHLRERAGGIELFVFSDDLVWVRENLRFDVPMTFVDLPKGTGDWNDMRLMSACKHHIIANSSFSWWGAWLNPDPEKVVIAPKNWFTDPAIDTKDLLPPDWIKL